MKVNSKSVSKIPGVYTFVVDVSFPNNIWDRVFRRRTTFETKEQDSSGRNRPSPEELREPGRPLEGYTCTSCHDGRTETGTGT